MLTLMSPEEIETVTGMGFKCGLDVPPQGPQSSTKHCQNKIKYWYTGGLGHLPSGAVAENRCPLCEEHAKGLA